MSNYHPPSEKDLVSLFPDIALEWDYERNNGLRPEQFTAGSRKKVWWKCKNCGISWQAAIANRTHGRGCPFDAGQRPIPRSTDLYTLSPHLAEEWDYERNNDLQPDQFTSGSNKIVWWKCKNCGMSWQASIANRVKGKGCPYDSGKLPILGKTDLATCFPHLAEEWDYERNNDLWPEQFTINSNKKVWWKCKNCGMSWQALITSRTHGAGCPYDAGRLPIPGQTDLATLRPDLSEEWDYERNGALRPELLTAHSSKKVWWKCKNCGMSWQATILNRAKGTGCPFESGRFSIPGQTDLASLRSDLAKEWDYERNNGLRPEQLTAGSHKKVWWKCKNCGMSWEASIYNRSNGKGCPYDAGKLPIPNKTDLATLRPDLVEEWNYQLNEELTPDQFTLHSSKKVWWTCKNCGQHWRSAIADRTFGYNCPYDTGRLPILGKTDLATLFPSIASAWDYERNNELRPEQFAARSHKKVWWKCNNCGANWQSTISNRTQGRGCPICHKR